MEKQEIERIVEIEQRSKSNTKRLDEHDKKIEDLEKTYSIMEKMDYRIGNMENSVNEIKTEIKNGKEQKGMKWDKLIDYLFYAIIGYALFKLGLK